MQKKYKLIVSDLDGTLAHESGLPSTDTVKAIDKHIAAGGNFAICTGRMPSGIIWLARDMGLKGVVSCGQGSFIGDIESGEVLSEICIPNPQAIAVCKFFESFNLHIHLYFGYDYYSNMDDDLLKGYEEKTRSKAVVLQNERCSQFLLRTGKTPNKILMMVDPATKDEYLEKAKQQRFAGCTVTSSAEHLIEIINENCSKGTALRYIAKHYGVNLEDVIGIGDQLNDIPLLSTAGLGIAVANAHQGLKEAADMVWEHTNEEDAVKEIIQAYGY